MRNVEIERGPNENTATVLRKFTKRVQESGILNRVRGDRYHSRQESPYVRKKKTLKVLARRKDIEKQVRMGKLRGR